MGVAVQGEDCSARHRWLLPVRYAGPAGATFTVLLA